MALRAGGGGEVDAEAGGEVDAAAEAGADAVAEAGRGGRPVPTAVADPAPDAGPVLEVGPVPAVPEAAPAPAPVTDTDETFATVILLDIPDRSPVVHTITCGHPPPLLLADGRVRTLAAERPALPIGLGGLPGAPEYEVETFPFEPGELLLLYTDGGERGPRRQGHVLPTGRARRRLERPQPAAGAPAAAHGPAGTYERPTGRLTPPRSRYDACRAGRRAMEARAPAGALTGRFAAWWQAMDCARTTAAQVK